MRRMLRVWLPILLLALSLTLVYFRQWILTSKSIGGARDRQKADLTLLTQADEKIREIASLQMALRVKLFGPQGADAEYLPPASPSGRSTLPASVVRAMGHYSIRLLYYRQKGAGSQVQFEGPYESMLRFLEAAGPDLPQVDGFWMDRADKNQVRLTLTFQAAAPAS